MKLVLKACFLAALAFTGASQAVTVGQFTTPTESFLNCDTADATLKAACTITQTYINQKLAAANLTIARDGIVYKVASGMNQTVNDDCTRKTTLTRNEIGIKIKKTASLNLSGNVISKPAVVVLNLPIEVYARIDVHDDFGISAYGPTSWWNPIPTRYCVNVGSNNYYADGTVTATGKLLALLSLEPKYLKSPEGDYIIALKPLFDIQASAGNAQVTQFDVHGANVLFNLFAAATSVSTATLNGADALINGAAPIAVAKDVFVAPLLEHAEALVLTDYALGNPLDIDRLINLAILGEVNKQINKQNGELADATAAIKAQITGSLNLDAYGKVYFVFDSNGQQKPVTAYHIGLMNPPPPQPRPIPDPCFAKGINNGLRQQQPCR